MKSMIMNAKTRLRLAMVGTGLILVLGGLAWAGLNEPDQKSKNPPPQFQVDPQPIEREAVGVPSYAPVVQKIAPSVVNIFTTTQPKRVEAPNMPFWDDPMFRRFFGDPFEGRGRQDYRAPKQHGLGSGVIVTEDGYILTNNHVVDGADEVKVALNSGKAEYAARVVGRDPQSDLAVLKIDATGLPVAQLGDSDYLQVGDVVLALGNPFGLGQTVTMGIVSATQRATLGLDYEDFIQTDAAINPGNSGGALVDVKGRLIGINTAILSRSGGNQGIGFAIPINLARSVMEGLIQDGRVVRGYLGVSIQNVTPELAEAFDMKDPQGALVSEVMPDTPADKAGLKNGDVIVEVNGKPVRDGRHLKLAIGQSAPGERIPLQVLRDGKTREVEVVLDELPSSGLAARSPQQAESAEEGLKGVAVRDLDGAARERFGLPKEIEGALVVEVDPESAAYEAGLRPGDVIREIDREPVRSAQAAVDLTRNLGGKSILLRVWSNGGSRFLVVDES